MRHATKKIKGEIKINMNKEQKTSKDRFKKYWLVSNEIGDPFSKTGFIDDELAFPLKNDAGRIQ